MQEWKYRHEAVGKGRGWKMRSGKIGTVMQGWKMQEWKLRHGNAGGGK